MTAYHLQLLRGNTSKQAAYTGKEGELIYNTQLKNLWVHDGSTKGGKQIACSADIPTKMSQLLNDVGYATLTNPNLSGSPTCSTPSANDNSTRLANTAWCLSSTGIVHTTGNETINGTKTFTSTINATSLRAMWADLAENYHVDQRMPKGTLIEFGGSEEITAAKENVHGVISDKPGFTLNETADENYQPIALTGRTPIRIIGAVKKFDKITLSKIPGVGKVKSGNEKVIAIALEGNSEQSEKLVECVTNLNLAD